MLANRARPRPPADLNSQMCDDDGPVDRQGRKMMGVRVEPALLAVLFAVALLLASGAPARAAEVACDRRGPEHQRPHAGRPDVDRDGDVHRHAHADGVVELAAVHRTGGVQLHGNRGGDLDELHAHGRRRELPHSRAADRQQRGGAERGAVQLHRGRTSVAPAPTPTPTAHADARRPPPTPTPEPVADTQLPLRGRRSPRKVRHRSRRPGRRSGAWPARRCCVRSRWFAFAVASRQAERSSRCCRSARRAASGSPFDASDVAVRYVGGGRRPSSRARESSSENCRPASV